MKVNDFKLLSQLPYDYEYQLITHENESIIAIGTRDKYVIGFIIKNNELREINFTTK